MNFNSQITSGICKLEIPRGEWPDIINTLIQTSSHENPNFRMASIVTIGYISQELTPNHLSSQEVDDILSALIGNMKLDTELEILSHAITAFLNFLIFAKKNMEIPNERDVIFGVIFECLKHPEVIIRVYSMQCLVEISRLYYDYLGSHIASLLSVTEEHIYKDDEKVAIQGFEFWCSVSDEEVIRVKSNRPFNQFCNIAIDNLFNICQHHFLNRNAKKEEIDSDAWNCAKAASCLLTNMSQCANDTLIDKVFALIESNINSDNALIRESSIFAFGAIVETRHAEKIRMILPATIATLLNMLKDKSIDVRSSVAWCLKKITEYHAEILSDVNNYDAVMNVLIENLKAHKRVVVHICDAINNLLVNLAIPNSSSGYVSKHTETLLNTLMEVGFTKDAYNPDNNVALAAFFTMGTLIDYAPNDTHGIISAFFCHIYGAFESTLDPKNFQSQEMRHAYQAYLATVISSCTVAEKVKMSFSEASAVYSLIKSTFEERQNVYEEGLMACSSIALSLGPDFAPLIENFGCFLMFALKQWMDVSICRTSINSTSDLLRGLGQCMSKYISQFIPVILDILENPASDKYLKTQAFIVISDMFIHTRDEAMVHYDRIMSIIRNALDAALFVPDRNEDPDTVEYFRSLREYLLECLTCIIQTLKDIDKISFFDDYVIIVLDFCNKVVDEKYDPSIVIIGIYFNFF